MFYDVPSVKDTVGVSGCFSVIIFKGLHRHVTTDYVGLYLVLYCDVNPVISQVFIFHFVSLKRNVKTAT